jgi:glutamate synthase (ferredoxin)
MSGGIAYVLDEAGDFAGRCNTEMADLFRLEDGDEIDFVYGLVSRFAHHTRSRRARQLLALWDETVPRFVKVYPTDYRRVVETQRRVIETGMSLEEAVMVAFEQNAHDAARIGGT